MNFGKSLTETCAEYVTSLLQYCRLNSSKAFRDEGINCNTRVEMKDYLDSSMATAIMGEVVPVDVIQNGNETV